MTAVQGNPADSACEALSSPTTGTTEASSRSAAAAPAWDLDSVFPGLASPEYRAARRRLLASVRRLVERFDGDGIGAGEPLEVDAASITIFDTALTELSAALEDDRVIGLYLAGRCWADSGDDEAAAERDRLQRSLAPLAALRTRFENWTCRLPLDDLCRASALAATHRHWLIRMRSAVRHRLPFREEELVAELQATGLEAWRRLHERQLGTAELRLADGRCVSLGVAAGLSPHGPAARRELHDARSVALARLAPTAADCLNAIKGARIILARRRGYSSSLSAALARDRVDEPVHDALHRALAGCLPAVQRFIVARARLLGGTGPLAIWDLEAPLPRQVAIPWMKATSLVERGFARLSPTLAALARQAFAERWVDGEARPRKRPVALCMPLRDGQSRLMVTYDGTWHGVRSLAHELGHSHHYRLLASMPELLRSAPLPVQEVASLHAEALVFEAARASVSDPDEELRVLDAQLVGMTRTLVGTHARFLFERSFVAERDGGLVTLERIRELQLDAFRQAYGNTVDAGSFDALHWVAVPHYYLRDFDNWLYAFGQLVANAIAAACSRGELSAQAVEGFLRHAGDEPLRLLARRIGLDLLDERSWARGAEQLRTLVARYEQLVDEGC